MARATTTPSAKQYVIHYTIHDGDHEYPQHLKQRFARKPTERQVVFALVDNLRCEDGDLANQQQAAWKQYQKHKYLEIPGDYRLVDDIWWEAEPSEPCHGCQMTPCACIPVGDEQDPPIAITPPPWSRNKNEVYGCDGRTFVADVFDENEAWRANVRLITAAPELREAVSRLLECPDLNVDELDIITLEAIQNARHVIAKADGEA